MLHCIKSGARAIVRPVSQVKMASYSTMNTIPAADVSETPLLQRDVKINAKTLVGGAALAAFVLGALAATAVRILFGVQVPRERSVGRPLRPVLRPAAPRRREDLEKCPPRS